MVRLEVLADWANVASQRVALGAGFTREGVRRSASVNRAGTRQDLVAFARTADDPPGPVERLLPDLPGGELTDGTVTLRPLTLEHRDFYAELTNSPSVIATSVPPEPKDATEIEQRCTRSAARWLAGERADLIIVDTATGTAVGDIGLFYQEPQTGQAMIGYAMMPDWRGRGYATRAATLVALWAFTETGIRRLIAGTLPNNVGSQRVLQKTGFRREGYLRSRLPGMNGTRVDDVQFALIAEDLLAAEEPLIG
jgi:RimJ/RimL family protein N-acetyltransferase